MSVEENKLDINNIGSNVKERLKGIYKDVLLNDLNSTIYGINDNLNQKTLEINKLLDKVRGEYNVLSDGYEKGIEKLREELDDVDNTINEMKSGIYGLLEQDKQKDNLFNEFKTELFQKVDYLDLRYKNISDDLMKLEKKQQDASNTMAKTLFDRLDIIEENVKSFHDNMDSRLEDIEIKTLEKVAVKNKQIENFGFIIAINVILSLVTLAYLFFSEII